MKYKCKRTNTSKNSTLIQKKSIDAHFEYDNLYSLE